MTKDELKDQMLESWVQTDSVQECIEVAIEYSDLQNKELIDKVKELETNTVSREVYNDLASINDFGTKCLKEKELLIEQLQSQLAEKDKRYNELLFRYDERSKGLSYYQKLSINLQSELTELKEKHTFLCKQYNNLCNDNL